MRQAQRFQGQLEKKEMKSLFSPIALEIFELASCRGGMLRVAHHGNWGIRVSGGRRATCVVHHVLDAARPGCREEDREQIVEA
jgi:hypothetical protein